MFSDRGEIISAGNFHGEYPAKALDYLAIGVHELAAMSERRTERLVNPCKIMLKLCQPQCDQILAISWHFGQIFGVFGNY